MKNKNLLRALRRKKRVRKLQRKHPYPRISIVRSNRYIYAQVIKTGSVLLGETDKVLCEANCINLAKDEQGLDKKQRAALVGAALAQKLSAAKIERVQFDRSGYQYHGRVKALAEALREGGVNF